MRRESGIVFEENLKDQFGVEVQVRFIMGVQTKYTGHRIIMESLLQEDSGNLGFPTRTITHD